MHDPSENRGVVHRAAVPATVPELVLALLDAHLGAFADVMDVVLVKLTQLLLALRQAHQLAAQRLRANDVSLRDEQRVHGQRPGDERDTRHARFHRSSQMKERANEQLTTLIRCFDFTQATSYSLKLQFTVWGNKWTENNEGHT